MKNNIKTKIKKSKIFFIVITLLYILLEILFRVDLLNTTATMKDFIDMEAIEVSGRFLASIGFVIFVLSNLSFKNIAVKIFAYPLLAIISFCGFYQSQVILVDSIGSHFNHEEKANMALLIMDKEAIYFNKLNHKDISIVDKNDETKIMLSMYPFLRYNNENHLKVLNEVKNQLIEESSNIKYKTNKEHFNILLNIEIGNLRNYYYFYKRTFSETPSRKIFTSKEKYFLYKQILSLYPYAYKNVGNFNQSKLNEYRKKGSGTYYQIGLSLKADILKKYNTIGYEDFKYNLNNSKYMEEGKDLKTVVYEKLYKKLEFDNGLNNPMSPVTKYAYPLLFDAVIDGMPLFFKENDYGVDINNNNCNIYKSEKPNVLLNIDGNKKIYSSNETDFKKSYESIFNEVFKKEGVYSIECKLSYTNYKQKYSNFYNKYFKNNPVFMSNINPRSVSDLKPEYVQNSPIHKRIAINIFHQVVYETKNVTVSSFFKDTLEGKYEDFYKTLDFSTSEKFSKSLDLFLLNVEKDIFYEKVKKNGINLDFLKNMPKIESEKAFYDNKIIKNAIKQSFPFLIKDNKVILSSLDIDKKNMESFSIFLAKKQIEKYKEALNNSGLMMKDRKYEELGNGFAKGFVSVPLVLIISTFMIMLSFINVLIQIVAFFNIDYKKLMIVKVVMFSFIILLPLLIQNNYTKDNDIINENTFLLKNTTNWLLNSQSIVEIFHFNNILFNKSYEFVKFASYQTAYSYNSITDKSNDNIELKIYYHKKEFDY